MTSTGSPTLPTVLLILRPWSSRMRPWRYSTRKGMSPMLERPVMIMTGLSNMGDIPFRVLYLHGLIRDDQGRKMSKTVGNVGDPVEVIDRYGADALRYALATGSSPGNDMKLSEQKLEAARNFANKLWNAARFVLTNLEDGPAAQPQPSDQMSMPLE